VTDRWREDRLPNQRRVIRLGVALEERTTSGALGFRWRATIPLASGAAGRRALGLYEVPSRARRGHGGGR